MDRTTTQGAVTLFARLARECSRDARRCKREGNERMQSYYRGQCMAWSLAARHLHRSMGARIKNVMRRAA